MNHIYRSIWNEALGTWIAVSEIAKGQGKRSSNRRKLLATGLLICTMPAWALPTGEQLMAGQASVNIPNANTMQINQASQKAVLNWQGFSVGQQESVNIQQPNAQAALLNRVVGQDASQIQGKINANGQVYLVNPNGVLFSKTAQVDVGGLVATTHDISNQDFMNGNNHFTQNGAKGTVENHGTINTPEGGVVALIGESVTNTGTINTPKGTTALAAGKTVDLDFKGDGLVEVKVTESALNAQITNKGAIQADGGRVVLTAKAAGQLIDTVINQQGVIRAQGLVERNGEIILEGGYVSQTGTLDTSGKTGGTVDIKARAILDAGTTNADGTAGSGGKINLFASDTIIQTALANAHANGATTGGTVHLEATNSVFSSGKLSATGETGGIIDVVSNDRVVLAAADVDASGTAQGGLVRVGGDFHGANAKLPNAKTTIVNGATKIKADGGKGKVVVWSNEKTDHYGSISANKAGNIEVSSKGILTYSARADAGVGGSLLLDPKNIIISASGSVASYELIDPHKAAGNQFGLNTTLLGTTAGGVFTENGNIAVSSHLDDLAATDAGAVYLFNTTTGALLATLTGSTASNQVGSTGITALTNGNYVVASASWNGSRGAVTWGSGTAGITGAVSSSNSLVGTITSDPVGNQGIIALSNGNYVVNSYNWDKGTIVNVGAVTWGSGTAGITGAVSTANSLVGSKANDQVGFDGITALTNGNYVVGSRNWDNGTIVDAGAATWSSGTTGITGAVSTANSLVGSTASNLVGRGGITALSNGNYVVNSYSWDNGTILNVGAATWSSGTAGITGAVSTANSLVGSRVTDNVGIGGITALTNGNYVVRSENWDNGTIGNAGAATWSSGTAGITGAVSASNSLVGSTANDQVGLGGITALSNGNYVVSSRNWSNGTILNVGAVTWGDGTAASSGAVSTANSLVGSKASDRVGLGGITALSNGNYVVRSDNWRHGTVTTSGAVTWRNGTAASAEVVSSTNSLVGSTIADQVGKNGITALSNGHYVVRSDNWDNGAAINAGAVTWGSGTAGITGAVSSTNSLVGSTASDQVGIGGITALSNGNYVVSSSSWNGNKGAVSWGNGSKGISGVVSTLNSLTGSVANDNVGNVIGLSNGNYVVYKNTWDNAGLVDAGQVRIATPQNINFNNGLGQTMTFNPSFITETLATGTNITLQASNDITLNPGTDIIIGGNNGGAFTMQAGRNINLNSRIVTANGNFTAIAGDPNAIPADRDPGTPTLTLGSGATINAGTGKVVLAAIGGDFVNNSGSTAPITAGQWLVYSTDPRLNARNGMVADFKHYAQAYTGVTPDYATTGNWFLYSITPVLTVTPGSQTVSAGGQIANFIPGFSGFIDGDTVDTAGINGTGVFGIENFTNTAGRYNVTYLRGLASRLGYVFVDNAASINELTVESVNPVHEHNVQINIFNFNFWLSQLVPLQTSTTFLNWYHGRHAHHHHHDDVDDDFGQYKGDYYAIKTLSHEWRREHGKKYWHEKKRHHKHKNFYANLLVIIENNGIKLPTGWLFGKLKSLGF